MPLSNPTRLHEADPKDLYAWTEGRALIATGSPFPPVSYAGREYEIAECNNSCAFPGIGLGMVLSRSRLLTKGLIIAAVKAIAAKAPAVGDPRRGLVPGVEDVWEVSVMVAVAVVRAAVREGVAREEGIPPVGDEGDGEGEEEREGELEAWVRAQMWEPRYRELVRVEKRGSGREGGVSALARGEAGTGGTSREAR